MNEVMMTAENYDDTKILILKILNFFFGTPNHSNWQCVRVNTPEALQATVSEELAQGPYVAVRVGFEPATFRTEGTKPYHWATTPYKYVLKLASYSKT